MKKLITTACLITMTAALGACTSASGTHHSSASYAKERTAGDLTADKTMVAPKKVERTFQKAQIK